jgi:hypothetical protein
MARLTKTLRGIAAMVERWHPDYLTAQGSGLTDSEYGQRGPRPGTQVPASQNARLVPEITEYQSGDLEVYVTKGGGVGIATTAAEIAVRAEGASTWLSWAAPNWFVDMAFLQFDSTGAVDWNRFDVAVVPSTQRAVVVATQSAGTAAITRYLDPDALTWSNGASPTSSAGPFALAVEPETERLFMYDENDTGVANDNNYVWRSDDGGATWAQHSGNPQVATGAVTHTRARMRFDNTGNAVLVVRETAGTLHQFASADLVTTFDAVGSTIAGTTDVCLEQLPDGRLVLGYRRAADQRFILRTVASAFESLSDATESDPLSGVTWAAGQVVMWVDPDGTMWLTGRESAAAAWRMYRSSDYGVTFNRMTDGELWYTSTTANNPSNLIAAACDGRAVIVTQWATDTNDGSLAAYIAGGWSDVCGGSAGPADVTQRILARSGFGEAATTSVGWPGAFVDPSVTGWVLGGSGATVAYNAGGWLTITSAANSGWYSAPGTAGTTVNAMWKQAIVSGGALGTATLGAIIIQATALTSYELRLQMTTTGFRVRDQHGAVDVADVAIDLTTPLVFQVRIISGITIVRYRRPSATRWTTAASFTLVGSGAGGTRSVSIGNVGASAAGASAWYWGFARYTTMGYATTATPAGRNLAGYPFPLPEVSSASTRAFIRGRSGPGALGDEHEIAAEYDHPIRAMFPTARPSPQDAWEQDGTTLAEVVLDFERDTRLGGSWTLALFLGNVGQRQVVLEGMRSGGGAYTTLGTWDGASGFAGLDYTLTGDMLRSPGTGANASRWLQAGELRGNFVILETGGGAGTVARRVADNSAGGWGPAAAGGMTPWIRLEGLDGTEDATGQCDFVRTDGVLVVHLTGATAQHYRYLRLRLAAGQASPEGRYRIGAACLATFSPLGRQYGKGWTMEWAPNVRGQRDPYGTDVLTEQGPLPRTLSIAWPDLVHRSYTRASIAPDYMGPSAGAPLAARDDVVPELVALFERAKSGEYPVIALMEVPDAGGMITDRTLYVYGTLRGTVSATHGAGLEGAAGTESQRIEGIQIRELV